MAIISQKANTSFYPVRQKLAEKPTKFWLLFMQNKPNFQDTQMNVSMFLQIAYENKSNRTLGENKPNQSQFQTGHLLIDRTKRIY